MARLIGWGVKIKGLDADHTYVTSSDGGKWGCWGRNNGGKIICSTKGSSKRANCISQSASHAGIIYGITGVCHQTANRILYPGKGLVSEAKGYWASVLLYGTYGIVDLASLIEWEVRKKRCQKVKGSLGLKKRAVVFPTSNKRLKDAALESDISGYLNKVNALYDKELDRINIAALDTVEKNNFLIDELELMVEYRLGGENNKNEISTLKDLQSNLLRKKEDLDTALVGKDISSYQYAEEVNIMMMKLMEKSGSELGKDAHTKLFGIASDTIFQIVDAKILANYHKD